MAEPASIWPVIVGGLIAIGGVAITAGINVLMKRGDNENERKKRRAEKFEELVAAIYEHDHWLDTKRDVVMYGHEAEVGVSPLAKVEAISAVYFPRFNGSVAALAQRTRDFEVWMSKAALKRLRQQLDKINDGLSEAYAPYSQAQAVLINELKEFARREFQ